MVSLLRIAVAVAFAITLTTLSLGSAYADGYGEDSQRLYDQQRHLRTSRDGRRRLSSGSRPTPTANGTTSTDEPSRTAGSAGRMTGKGRLGTHRNIEATSDDGLNIRNEGGKSCRPVVEIHQQHQWDE